MATYKHKTRDEKAVTVNGSYHDRRLTMSKEWDRVDDAGTHQAEPEPPARNAPTEEWQNYATEVHNVPEDQASKMSRADLIARAETGPAAGTGS